MLTLSRAVYDAVIDHARTGAPEEVCGVLGGDHGDGESEVDRALRATNVADSPRTAYELDPAEQLDLMRTVEDAGREVVGFYHSHPAGPPTPSETDREQATWVGYVYVIVSLDGEYPYVGAWRWTGAAFEREAVAVSGGGDASR